MSVKKNTCEGLMLLKFTFHGMRRTESERFKGQLGLVPAGGSVVRANGTIWQNELQFILSYVA